LALVPLNQVLHGDRTAFPYHCGVGSMLGSCDTGSGYVIILGACKLYMQTYCLLQREAIC